MATLIAIFIVGFSVIMSLDRRTGALLDTAPANLLVGMLMAGIVYIVARYARQGPCYFFTAMTCPACRRIIPADSNLCLYCGQKLR